MNYTQPARIAAGILGGRMTTITNSQHLGSEIPGSPWLSYMTLQLADEPAPREDEVVIWQASPVSCSTSCYDLNLNGTTEAF